MNFSDFYYPGIAQPVMQGSSLGIEKRRKVPDHKGQKDHDEFSAIAAKGLAITDPSPGWVDYLELEDHLAGSGPVLSYKPGNVEYAHQHVKDHCPYID